jgi:glycosyltransferase involved in cell wall biosynthesis
MKIALIAPPFIPVPPTDYGGTELFVAQSAEGLQGLGHQVVVYANGESKVNVERHWRYERSQWPIESEHAAWLADLDHTSWAIEHAARTCDVIHVQSAQALALSRFVKIPTILTLHGPHDSKTSEFYARYPDVYYVAISDFQRNSESMPHLRTIHHGIDPSQYRLRENKQPYLSFIGRIAPIKGTHVAIDVAKRTGIPLKIAGDIQPAYREYFEAKIRPEIDGH